MPSRTLLMSIFVTLCCLALDVQAAPRVCRHRAAQATFAQVTVAQTSAVAIPAGFLAVPFAVPVALPSYVQYQAPVGATAGYSATFSTTSACPTCGIAPQGKADLASHSSDQRLLARGTIATNCLGCHGGAAPQAGLNLAGPLDESTRLNAIARILADDPAVRMPKGKRLDPESLGKLIQELAGTPPRDVSATGEPTTNAPAPASTATQPP